MNRFFVSTMMATVLSACIILSGCGRNSNSIDANESNLPELETIIDYSDWYYDIDNSNTYNCTQWIELDIWFIARISNYDWSGIKCEVFYDNQLVASSISVVADVNYVKCYYDINSEGAVLAENGWYLAPGIYEIVLKDSDNNKVYSSKCYVTAESGDVLLEKIVDITQIDAQDDEIAFKVTFDDDISPYTKTGFYITVSFDEGKTSFVPDKYTVELADTYMIVRCYEIDLKQEQIQISVYCKDGTYVCDCLN